MKNRLFLFLISIVLVCLFLSCSKETKNYTIEYIPYKIDKEDNWGMLKPDGTPLFKDEFEGTPSVVINGVFTVTDKNGVSVYTVGEKPKPIKDCENLKSAGIMSEGVIPIVKKGERIKYIDINGKEKFTLMPYKNKEIEEVSSKFYEGLALIRTSENKYGWINNKGKVVIEPKYAGFYVYFSNGVAIMLKKTKDKEGKEKYIKVIIDKSGKEKGKLKEDIEILIPEYTEKGFVATMGEKESRVVLLDKEAKVTKRFPSKVRYIKEINKDIYIYKNKEGKWGINNNDDETLVRAKYLSISSLENGTFVAQKDNDKFVIINDNDDIIKEFEDYTEMGFLEDWNTIIAYNKNDKYELINPKGELISKEEYILGFYTPSYVASDYFNVSALAKTISDYFIDNRVGDIELGQSVTNFLPENSSPYGYRNQNTLTVYSEKSGITSGNKFSLNTLVYTDSPIAMEKYRTEYYYGYAYDYYEGTQFNSSSKVCGIMLSVQLNTSENVSNIENLSKALKENFESKGYKTTDKGQYSFELAKGNKVIIVSPTAGDKLCVFLMKKDNRAMLKSRSEMEKQYLEAKERYNQDEDNYEKKEYNEESVAEAVAAPVEEEPIEASPYDY